MVVDRVRKRIVSPTGRSLIWSMMAAVAARVGLLLLAVVVGRRFGPAQYGAFTYASGVALLGAQFAVLGWPTLMNRLIPELFRDADWSRLRGLRDAGDAVVLGGSAAVALMLGAAAWYMPNLRTSFLLSVLLVPPFSFAIMRRQQLAAVRRPALGLMFDQGLGALIAVAIMLASGGGESIAGVVAIFSATITISVVIATTMFRRLLPRDIEGARRRVELNLWMGMAFPMLIGMSARLIMAKTDILMLAPLSDLHQTGLYGAAFRLTFLLTFPQVVMMSVVMPMISEAFAHRRYQQVSRLARGASFFALLSAIPTSLPLILFPVPILTILFGAQFAAAGPALVYSTIGQLATSLSIPAQSLLTMGGRERAYGMLNLGGLALHVLINLVLIPQYGATGAAISTMIVAVGLMLGQFVLNRRLLVGEVA
jgi:O-antigen/teichoic acid export membrane protein